MVRIMFRPWVMLPVITLSQASNWAQTTGLQAQTTTIPYMPSKQCPHWSARMGHGVAVSNVTNDGERIFGSDSYLFLIGGDDYAAPKRSDEESKYDENNAMRGYKNDVWRMRAADSETWIVKNDMIDRTRYDHSFPEQHATVRWELVSQGQVPDVGESYEEFIQCQEYYPTPQRTRTCDESESRRGWFSQRRHHAVAIYKQRLYVVGGRAREHVRLEEERAVGGIIGPRPKQEMYSTWREASVLKNDVWMSPDWGHSWRLVQPGCHSNQRELLLRDLSPSATSSGEDSLAQSFDEKLRCDYDSDCYGNQEVCIDHVCVCELWSPREQHQVAVFGRYMYLVGGFASRHLSYCDGKACGDTDAGGYREYMNDVWYTQLDTGANAAGTWFALTTGAEFEGRGGHAATVARLLGSSATYALYVLGGEAQPSDDDLTTPRVLNDVWYTVLPSSDDEDPVAIYQQQNGWTEAFSEAEWSPRTGHAVIVEPPSAINGLTQRMYVVGGMDAAGHELLGDVWSWGWECEANSDGLRYVDGECNLDTGGGHLVNGTIWRQDYTQEGLFKLDSGARLVYDAGQPQQHYVDADSPVEHLVKVYLPLSAREYSHSTGYPEKFTSDQALYGTVPRRERYVDDTKLAMLHRMGIRTVRDLANADRYSILKLRGYPSEPKLFDVTYDDICDHRALAIALIDKCTVPKTMNPLNHYDQEKDMPWNVVPRFVGGTPVGENKNYWKARWHGKYYNLSEPKSDEEIIDDWDGCSSIRMTPVNVPGIGDVPVPARIRDPWREVQNLVCKANPGSRAYHAGIYFDQRVYVMGGLTSASDVTIVADMWYRDDYLPRARIVKKPETLNFGDNPFNIFGEAEFKFVARPDKEGTILEHLLYDADEHAIVRTWDRTKSKVSVKWLDYWFKDGPGSGNYIFYVRSLDPAGNIDISFSKYNMYKWKYVTALPWHIISGTICGFIALCFLIYLEKKRRKRKAAMERYAIKRMRRKFKGAQKEHAAKGAVDWKAMMEKDKKKKKKKKKKKTSSSGGSKNSATGGGKKAAIGLKAKELEKANAAGKKEKEKDRERAKMKMKEKEKLKQKKA